MLANVLRECIACDSKANIETVPVLICVAEKNRPGRLHDLDDQILSETEKELEVSLRTVQRDWMRARAWLKEELGGSENGNL